MSLKAKINADYLSAFKNKDVVTKNLLSVIKGELQTLEKNTGVDNISDDEVTKILNKNVKSLKETISLMNEGASKELTKKELEILESYLPKQMSEDEIRVKITELIENGEANNIAEVMRIFGKLPADRSLVASTFHSLKK
jgi:uncharacterized protein YqeY